MALVYGRGSIATRLQSQYEETVYFLPLRSHSFDRPRKDERLSWPWSHPIVLNTGLLDSKSSAWTTRLQTFQTTQTSLNPISVNLFFIIKIIIFLYKRHAKQETQKIET